MALFQSTTEKYFLKVGIVLDHRTGAVGGDLWGSPCPDPLLKKGHLELVAHGYVQYVLNIPLRMETS